MIILTHPDSLLHRIGGATVADLMLTARDRDADPPGLSVLLYEDAVAASRRMRREFGDSKKWKRKGHIVATTTASAVTSAGFLVIEAPTHTLPNHGRIVHELGVEGFNEVNLRRLSKVFTTEEVAE